MKAIRKFFRMIFWGLLIAGVVILIAFVEKKHAETVCDSFELVISNSGDGALTDAEELRSQILAATDTLTGKTLAEIEPIIIHEILDQNPYVKIADIQTGIDGNMEVNVTLREAIVRIINANGLSYYLDRDGWIMPVNTGHPSRVFVINGQIKDGMGGENMIGINVVDLPENSVVRRLYTLSAYIIEDEFLHRLISQVYVDRQGEMELSPMVGSYTIHFGDMEDMEEKFEKLKAYYKEGAGKAGWINYKSIDLRYKNQVICSK